MEDDKKTCPHCGSKISRAYSLVMARKKRGLTQDQISSLMGVSQATVARLESGDRRMDMNTLGMYLKAIEATPEEKSQILSSLLDL